MKTVTRFQAFALMLVLCFMTLIPTSNVFAETSQEVVAVRNGVLRVDLIYVDKDNNEYLMKHGSGFLINEDTLITCAHVVNLDNEELAYGAEAFGEEFSKKYKERLKIRIVVMRDVYVYATVKNQSEQMDFAILTLDDSIHDREPLKLDKSGNVDSTMQVYALGFPGDLTYYQNVNSYTYDDVSITDGRIAKMTTIKNVDMIQHSAALGQGNSGGPLVGEDGVVVGVNNAMITDEGGTKYFYAITIDQVISTLEALGVDYTAGDGSGSSPDELEEDTENATEIAEEPEEILADKSALSSAISEAKEKDLELYTEESAANFNDALSEAEAVHADSEAEQSAVDAAASKLKTASEALEEKPTGPNIVLIGGIVGAVVVVIIIILVVVLAGGKKKNKSGAAPQPIAPTPSGPRPPVAPGPAPQPHAPRPTQPTEGGGETTVLSAGAGETTLLGGGMQASAKLIRVKTGESIAVNKPEFILGKERNKVNYCISGDSSISRSHAKISVSGGEYVVTDLRSTNGTFVNGKKVEAGSSMPLKNGDKLMLSEEEFEFRV